MRRKILFLIGLTLAGASLRAQELLDTKRKFYVNQTEFGILAGRVKYPNLYNGNQEQVDNKFSLTVQTFNGIQIDERFATGITVGMDWYKAALLNPVAVGFRYNLTKKSPVKLFATADVGYGFTWFHDDSEGFDTKGGLMINPGLGLKYGRKNGAAFTIAMTYKRQEARVNKPVLWDQTERSEERIYNRLALRLGMSF
ncbi:hypothetical protein [Dyadobacter bucti]|uniref:hypothetical protein n=1 Tax=Dyadobacter bucti TaxID=2572203 RepID=UPI001107D520|nr:hypothetical protein [Dyadobacter bucti]